MSSEVRKNDSDVSIRNAEAGTDGRHSAETVHMIANLVLTVVSTTALVLSLVTGRRIKRR